MGQATPGPACRLASWGFASHLLRFATFLFWWWWWAATSHSSIAVYIPARGSKAADP